MADAQQGADVQRLIGEFLQSEAIKAHQGEKEGLVAHAMIEAGVQVLLRTSGPRKVAAALRQMADAVEQSASM